MTLDQLKYFVTAAKQEHLGQAAKLLNVTPSTISHAVSALESELGQRLLEKRGKNIAVTQTGKELMIRAEKLLYSATVLKEEFLADLTQLKGHYKIAATHFLAEKAIVPALLELRKDFPKITSEIYSLRSAEVVEGIIQGKFDCGICFSPQTDGNLKTIQLHKGNLVPVVHKYHPILKKKGKASINALNQYPHIGAKPFKGIEVCEINPIYQKFDLKNEPILFYDSYEVAIATLMQSDAWGLLPDWLLENSKDEIVGSPLPRNWEAKYEINFVYSKKFSLNTFQKYLLQHLQDVFK